MDNRRLLLATFLSAVIVIGWNLLFAPPPPVRPPAPAGDDPAVERRIADDPAMGHRKVCWSVWTISRSWKKPDIN